MIFFLACASPSIEPLTDSASEGFTFSDLSENDYTVANLNPARYLGLWYEIATIPSGFQARCTGTTANYTLLEPGVVGVENRCFIDSLDGSLSVINGTAEPEDDDYAHLKVNFGGSFSADYYVVELDGSQNENPYDWAAVSTFSDRVLWILSRTPSMASEEYDLIVDKLAQRDLPVDKLVETEHQD